MKINKPRIIFVEGETEYRLFSELKALRLIDAKKIVLKNLWNENVKKYAITIPANYEIIIVFDTDVIENPKRFIDNIKYLISRRQSVFLMQQTLNFEDELAHCCAVKLRVLYSFFSKVGKPTATDFKRDFIACKDPVQKLLACGMDQDKWFSRELNTSLKEISKYSSNFTQYFNVRVC